MRVRLAFHTAALLVIAGALSCATTSARPPPRSPSSAAPGAEPVPAPSRKRGVVVPSDVKLGGGPSDSTSNTGTAGPAVGPSVGTSSGPN